jgi:succinyl-diaminopimelate desuccinylase
VVIGEQSGLRVVAESKGIAQVRLTARGVSAHAAYPWLGRNALVALQAAVGAVLARYPTPEAEAWTTTVNLARIETDNRALNQVPASAAAWLDIRFPPEDTAFAGRSAEEIAEYLRTLAGVSVDVVVENLGAPHSADPGAPDVVRLQAATRAAGYSGELLRKHGPDEYLDLRTLGPYREAVIDFLRGV